MTEMLTDRIRFCPGQQKAFISKCQAEIDCVNGQLARNLNVSVRTLTDWKRERFLMTLRAARWMSNRAKISLPRKIKTVDQFWYAPIGAKKAGVSVYKKYGYVGGDPETRKMKWLEWWKVKGKFIDNPILKAKRVDLPKKSEMLAEFVGILMGDGGISKRQITITLHSVDDKDYLIFVVWLIKKLFGITAKVYRNKKFLANNVVISRTALVDFCTKTLGLPLGNKIKQHLDIPVWIKRKKDFRLTCIRGLMDTDGCLVIHKYKVNRKTYRYKKLNFSSASQPLVSSVIHILKEFDFKPRLSHNGRNVWIDSQSEVIRYFRVIGSNNPKHKERFLR